MMELFVKRVNDYFRKKLFYRCLIERSSHRRCSIKTGVFENFAKFTGKHLSQRCNLPLACYFIKKETLTQVFSCEFFEIFKNTFLTEHLWTTAFILTNTQRWFNVDICWNNVAMSVNLISTLIQRRFVNVDSSIKFNVETTLILRWL